MRTFSVNAVVCSRSGTFDAEVHFVEETYCRGEGTRNYVSKLISSGHATREVAKSIAEAEAIRVEGALRGRVVNYLSQYSDAKA